MTTANPTTGIGSLPHHNIDAALEHSFQMGLPFLPQIPIRNPWEFMIAQALEGMPGLQVERDGSATLNTDVWHSRTHEFTQRLNDAFEKSGKDSMAFSLFEPSPAVSSSWQPFLWEIEERGIARAKIQITGPMTAQWALRLKDGDSLEKYPDITTQIYRLVMARALAMSRRLQSIGAKPVLYLDEPGLYAFSAKDPKHVLALRELRLLIQTLQKNGVIVGLHCCSNTDWKSVLGLGLDILSLDASLSLETLLSEDHRAQVESFLDRGGRLSLGVIPTGRASLVHSFRVPELFAQLLDTMGTPWHDQPERIRKTLSTALYTPACGLALHSPADAEWVLDSLQEFYGSYIAQLGTGV